jgi:hypothetical protein
MAVEFRCLGCGESRRVLTTEPFRCPCGGRMKRATRPGLPELLARHEPPDGRGLAWGAVGFGAFLLFGVLLLLGLIVLARSGKIPGVSRDLVAALRIFAGLQLLFALGIIGGGVAMLMTRGRFIWLLTAALAGFALLRVADVIVAARLGQTTLGGCFGAAMVLGIDLWLLVLVENHRRALMPDQVFR